MLTSWMHKATSVFGFMLGFVGFRHSTQQHKHIKTVLCFDLFLGNVIKYIKGKRDRLLCVHVSFHFSLLIHGRHSHFSERRIFWFFFLFLFIYTNMISNFHSGFIASFCHFISLFLEISKEFLFFVDSEIQLKGLPSTALS